MVSYRFHFRPSTKIGTESFPGSLYLRIIHHRKSVCITTKYKILQNEWDERYHRLVLPPIDSPRMKYLLDIEDCMQHDMQKLSDIVGSLESNGYYTLNDVVSAFHYYSQGGTLSMFVEKLCSDLVSEGRERTARAYRTCCDCLVRFTGEQGIRLEHINSRLVRDYEKWLRNAGKSLNTISFYMRNLRAIYNKAIKEHLLQSRSENPFAGVYTGVHVTKKRALSKEEILMLSDLDLLHSGNNAPDSEPLIPGPEQLATGRTPLTANLRMALAMFMFCFHARGMSFVDLAYLKKTNIMDGRLAYFRRKTGQWLEIKITGAMANIISFFSKETENSPYVFPIIKNPDGNHRLQYESGLRIQNCRLKTLTTLAGMDKNVTTHVARHSWATIAKREKFPLWVISEGLGHNNEKTTYIYLASFDRSEIDFMSDKISGLIKSA